MQVLHYLSLHITTMYVLKRYTTTVVTMHKYKNMVDANMVAMLYHEIVLEGKDRKCL